MKIQSNKTIWSVGFDDQPDCEWCIAALPPYSPTYSRDGTTFCYECVKAHSYYPLNLTVAQKNRITKAWTKKVRNYYAPKEIARQRRLLFEIDGVELSPKEKEGLFETLKNWRIQN